MDGNRVLLFGKTIRLRLDIMGLGERMLGKDHVWKMIKGMLPVRTQRRVKRDEVVMGESDAASVEEKELCVGIGEG